MFFHMHWMFSVIFNRFELQKTDEIKTGMKWREKNCIFSFVLNDVKENATAHKI